MSENTAFAFTYDDIEPLRIGERLVLLRPTWNESVELQEGEEMMEVVGFGGKFSIPSLEDHFVTAVQEPEKIKVVQGVTSEEVAAEAGRMAKLLKVIHVNIGIEHADLHSVEPLRPQLETLL